MSRVVAALGTLLLLAAAADGLKRTAEAVSVPLEVAGSEPVPPKAAAFARAQGGGDDQVRSVDLGGILARPLFAPERRPMPPVEEVAPVPPPEEPDREEMPPSEPEPLSDPEPDPVREGLRLHGVMSGGSFDAALVSLPGTPAWWQRRGTEIEGWHLDRIGSDRIELRRGADRLVVSLRDEAVEPSGG